MHRYYIFHRDKVERMESKSKSLKKAAESDFDESDIDDNGQALYGGCSTSADPSTSRSNTDNHDSLNYASYTVPPQPIELLPSYGRMPEELRQKIYKFLR